MARKAKTEPEVMTTDVVFQLPAFEGASEVVLVGDFNDWSESSLPMTRTGDMFEIIVPLMKGQQYSYKYLVDGHRWENDWNADQYVPNEFGGDDSVRTT